MEPERRQAPTARQRAAAKRRRKQQILRNRILFALVCLALLGLLRLLIRSGVRLIQKSWKRRDRDFFQRERKRRRGCGAGGGYDRLAADPGEQQRSAAGWLRAT